MIESKYTSNIHQRLPANVYHWKINDNFAGGVPDAFYRVLDNPDAKPMWVEYKLIKALPKRASTRVIPDLSPQQLVWLKQTVNNSEIVRVVVGVESEKVDRQVTGIILEPNKWETGFTSEEYHSNKLTYSEMAKIFVELMSG
ncbi:hypothetical protein [Shewanella gaetbuli]|uniref:Uncharacterized protein n=1 Tax=Shewanella gaetbuli TaxID=220752 RepID=A0A9X1ZIH0_9GAMM|nr:hypothetical protein [Shewanella gaetbuli]MCL1142944.1 hypothetical protein [Shewanella gaetbuli]